MLFPAKFLGEGHETRGRILSPGFCGAQHPSGSASPSSCGAQRPLGNSSPTFVLFPAKLLGEGHETRGKTLSPGFCGAQHPSGSASSGFCGAQHPRGNSPPNFCVAPHPCGSSSPSFCGAQHPSDSPSPTFVLFPTKFLGEEHKTRGKTLSPTFRAPPAPSRGPARRPAPRARKARTGRDPRSRRSRGSGAARRRLDHPHAGGQTWPNDRSKPSGMIRSSRDSS